jgi:hypothetical protein
MGIKEILQERENQFTDGYEITASRNRLKMISFMMRDGSIHCGNYSYLHGVSGNDCLIQMDFTRRLAVIRGANLDVIYRGLSDHRVSFLKEMDPEVFVPKDKVRIDRISIVQGRGAGEGENPLGRAQVGISIRVPSNKGRKRFDRILPKTTDIYKPYQG